MNRAHSPLILDHLWKKYELIERFATSRYQHSMVKTTHPARGPLDASRIESMVCNQWKWPRDGTYPCQAWSWISAICFPDAKWFDMFLRLTLVTPCRDIPWPILCSFSVFAQIWYTSTMLYDLLAIIPHCIISPLATITNHTHPPDLWFAKAEAAAAKAAEDRLKLSLL